ncbi:c-type cytochrome [Bartonella rattaustraliani]|uniref:c-type cytochrome n=1 Tax=Bartonella rattaustraliani TaxID=481139 RepID=UPI000476E4C9|nr:c-type cytochrome [Bartonella rattaustraliani]
MKRFTILYFICSCFVVLVVLAGISILSDRVYVNSGLLQPPQMAKNDALKEKQVMPVSSLSLSRRLQQGDFENGRKIFHQCAICHTSGRNEKGRVGPMLWDIVNRPFAATPGFVYSRVLRANSDKKWDFFTLDRYLQSPRQAFPGTIMSFPGIKNDQDRADLLLYLRSLSDHPVPLPVDNKEGEQSQTQEKLFQK